MFVALLPETVLPAHEGPWPPLAFPIISSQLWNSLAGDHRLVVSPDDVVSGGCVRCSGTNSRPSAWPWQQRCTTRVARCRLSTALHGARSLPPGNGRGHEEQHHAPRRQKPLPHQRPQRADAETQTDSEQIVQVVIPQERNSERIMEHAEDMEGIVEVDHVAPALAAARRRRTGKYAASALAVAYATPATVSEYVASSLGVACAASALVVECAASAPAVTYPSVQHLYDTSSGNRVYGILTWHH